MTSSFTINNPLFLLINDTIPHTGHFNMEFDRWLFELVQKGSIKNVFRIYEWERPAITYGRSQQIEKEINKKACGEDNIELVKRPTGGRAVLHFHEITFSLAFQPATVSPYNFRNAFLFAADMVIQSFSLLKIKSKISLKPERYQDKTVCFQSTAQYEIIDEDNKKLAGIAQYFTRKGTLIQGSIPLRKDLRYKRYFKIKDKNFLQNRLIKLNLKRDKIRDGLIKSAGRALKLVDILA